MNSGKRGTIIKWFDEKGYGFIESVGGGPQLFFHIRSIRNSQRRDLLGEQVTYQECVGKDSRPAAADVYLVVEGNTPRYPPAVRRSRRPIRLAALLAWVACLGFMGVMVIAVNAGYFPLYLLFVYAGMSILTFIVYATDKAKAGTGYWRTPEATLHWLEFLGGWPGALAAQWHIGHKNRKISYQVVFWFIVTLHIIGLIIIGPRKFTVNPDSAPLPSDSPRRVIIEDVPPKSPRIYDLKYPR